MKRILFVILLLAAAAGAWYAADPVESTRYAGEAEKVARRAWAGVEANPGPVAFALATFLLTVVYYKAKGKTLRESLEVAATRVTVVAAPAAEPENAVVKRARARATRAQLLADQIGLQNRLRKLPEAVLKAEKEACYTEQALADASRALAAKRHAHDEAVAKLDALRDEQAAGDAELAEIDVELKKLADIV
jgi:hypothetical protein